MSATRRSERASAAVVLVALVLGAVAAGSATVAAQPRVTPGLALAGSLTAARASTTGPPAPSQAPGTRPRESPPAAPPQPTAEPTSQPATEPSTEPSTEPTTPPATTAPATTTPAPAPAAAAASQADQVVALVNAARERAGCRPLAVDQRLVTAAQEHSTDMSVNDYFSHTSLDGRTFADRIRAAGYPRPAAENIARGQRSAEQVVRAWLDSRGHRANILDCEHTTIGVGLDTRGWYWTQDFGR